MARLWKTKYPLAVRKIGEYATGLPGNSAGRFCVSLRYRGVRRWQPEISWT